MKKSGLLTATAVLGVVAVLAIAFAVSQFSSDNVSGTTISTGSSSLTSSGSTYSTNSILAGNETYVATFQSTAGEETTTVTTASSMSTSPISTSSTLGSTSTTSSFSTSSAHSQNNGDSYSYSASSQVKILSVEATVSGSQPGDETVTFWVKFENIGSSNITLVEAAGSGLNATITSGNSIVSEVTGPRCEIVVALAPVSPGSSQTTFTPGCWSGYHFLLLGPGTIGADLTLTWFSGASQGAVSKVTINAEFNLA